MSAEAIAAGLTAEQLADTMIPATQQGDAFFQSMNFFKTVETLRSDSICRTSSSWASGADVGREGGRLD